MPAEMIVLELWSMNGVEVRGIGATIRQNGVINFHLPAGSIGWVMESWYAPPASSVITQSVGVRMPSPTRSASMLLGNSRSHWLITLMTGRTREWSRVAGTCFGVGETGCGSSPPLAS